MKAGPKLELMTYQDRVHKEIEDMKEHLKTDWENSIHDIYKSCKKKRQLPLEARMPAFLRCLGVQMTNQIQSLCLESMRDFNSFVESLNKGKPENQRAGFVMSLKAINSKIIFYPTFEDVESAILETYDVMIKATNDIPRYIFNCRCFQLLFLVIRARQKLQT